MNGRNVLFWFLALQFLQLLVFFGFLKQRETWAPKQAWQRYDIVSNQTCDYFLQTLHSFKNVLLPRWVYRGLNFCSFSMRPSVEIIIYWG